MGERLRTATRNTLKRQFIRWPRPLQGEHHEREDVQQEPEDFGVAKIELEEAGGGSFADAPDIA